MMSVALGAASRGRLSARALALVGTSLGCSLLLPAGAHAQNVYSNGTTDYSLASTGTISGGPRTVDITTSGGDITLNLAAVNTANNGNTLGTAIAGNNTGPGNVNITSGTATATGTGQTYAIDARTTTGDILIDAGTTTANTNATSRGIYAITGSGNITINAGETDGGTRAIYTGFNGGDGPNVTTITSQTATTNGTTLTDTILGQGNTVNITSGTASNTNAAAYQGVTILANAGTGGATIVAGTTSALGQNQAAIQAFSDGAVSITSDTVNTTQSSDGITVESGTTIAINSKTVTTLGDGARAIVLGGADGGGSLNGGADGIPYVSADVTSSTISTEGANAYGIYATPTSGATTITSDAITTTGTGATGIYVTPIGAGVLTGATTINSTGTLSTSGGNADGILVANSSGAVAITANAISTTGGGSSAIVVTPTSGSTAPITIDAGTIRVAGSSLPAIDLASTGNAGSLTVSVADSISLGSAVDARSAGAVSVASGTAQVTGTGAFGINATSSADSATVNSTTLSVTDGRGIFAQGATATSVTSGTLTTSGSDYDYALIAQNGGSTGNAGTVTVNSGTLTSGAGGIFTYAPAGPITIVSGTASSAGIDTNTIFANAAAGAITINADTVSASGLGSHGISAQTTTGDIAIRAANVAATGGYDENTGAGADALIAFNTTSGAGKITINAGTTSATADYASAIFAEGGGAVTITSGNASASGASTDVVGGVSGTSDVTINADQTEATGAGGVAIAAYAKSGNTTVNAGTASASGGTAISADAGHVSTVTAMNASGGGDGASGIEASGGTGVVLNIGSASSNGAALTTTNGSAGVTTTHRADAIDATATNGAIIANIGSATATGAGSDAVYLNAGGTGGAITAIIAGTASATGANSTAVSAAASGDVTVSAATVNSGGAGNGNFGIYATSGTGAANVTATNVTSAGRGIYAAGNTVSVNAGDLSTTGDNDTGIFAFSTAAGGGAVSLTSTGALTTSGAGADGIAEQSAADIVTITNSGTIATTGANSMGIRTGVGSATIVSNDVQTSGAGSSGIYGYTTTGPLSITSNSVESSGANSEGAIYAQSGSGSITINSGTITAAGDNAQGINAYAGHDGAITINSGTVTAMGINALGIDADAGGSGAVTINADTTSAAGSDAIVGAGRGDVTINSRLATTGGYYGSAVAAISSGGGAVLVNSGTGISNVTGGAGAGAFNVGGISRNTGGIVTINSGTSTISGAGTAAVYGSADGNVTITSGTATAIGGTAIDAESASGIASVTATIADGGTGVYASGGTGVVLDIGSASSTNNTVAGAALNARGDAIVATAVNGAILANIGSATATGAGSDAVHLVADGTGGAVTANISGTVSSASGTGLFIDPPGAVAVNIGSGASVSGATAGIDTTGATNAITNAGTISGTAGPGILASGATTLVDSGAISGANGVAVQLGAADDTVTLQTGAAITGRINGGGGIDAAILSGTSTAATSAQTIAGFDGFDSLTVQSGYWTAQAANTSSFNSATIDGGATLEVANGAAGITGVTAPSIVDNGNLVIASNAASGGSTFGSTLVSGSGNVTFTGAGTATLDGTNSIATTGTITVDGGSTLQVTGTQGGTVVAGSGGTLVVGNGGTTGALTGSVVDNGTLVLDRSDSSTFAAALTGTGNVVKEGVGELTFGSNYAFTGTTTIEQGAIKLSTPIAATTTIDLEGAGELDLSGTNQQIAQLSGASANATINIAGGSLTVDQSSTTSFAGSITGNGSLTKTGSGSLNLTGVNTYTGPTVIDDGRLAVNGSITSPVTVNAGGILGGNGTVGTVTIASGGTYAPGNSIGTQTVNGNVTFAAGSIYEVQANAAGQADRINATGTATLNGGTVEVLAAAGTYARLTNYTILTAAGGVTGKFASVTSNMAFLSPLLTYGSDTVSLTLARNDIAFGAVATSPREIAVANAIAARGLGDTIYNTVLFDSTPAAQQTFNQLSGELHASLPSELADTGRRVRGAVLDHLTPDEGLGVWGQGLQSYSSSRPQAGLNSIDANRTGAVGGVDYAHEGIVLGLIAGYVDDQVRIPAAASHAHVDMKIAGADASYHRDALEVRVGGTFAWQHVGTERQISAPGFATTLYASPHANTAEVFGEVGYALTHGAVKLTPFVGDAFNWTRIKSFTEVGGLAALSVARDSRSTDFLSAGIHMTGSAPVAANIALLPKVTVSYEHGFGDLNGSSVAQIGGTGPSFAITGARLGRDTLNVDTGFDLLFEQKLSVGASGFASTSSQWSDYGVKASIGIRF